MPFAADTLCGYLIKFELADILALVVVDISAHHTLGLIHHGFGTAICSEHFVEIILHISIVIENVGNYHAEHVAWNIKWILRNIFEIVSKNDRHHDLLW